MNEDQLQEPRRVDQGARPANPVMIFFGWVFVLTGVLIAGLAGLCTLAMAPSMSLSTQSGGWVVMMIFGGTPFAMGAGLVIGGVAMIKAGRARASDEMGE